MKRVEDILKGLHVEVLAEGSKESISNLSFDSRKVDENSLFIAMKGTVSNGHDFLQAAYLNGCKNFLVEEETEFTAEGISMYKVESNNIALGIVASNFYDNPSAKINLIGITGTNGKTTSCTLLHSMFESMGIKSGLISTVVNKIGKKEIPATHTTPDPIQLNKLLSEMLEYGCQYCFMEVSSHAIHQGRINGLRFFGGAFTNITHDHLDYHKTFKEYISVKKQFFDNLPKSAFALTNVDDKNGRVMTQNCNGLVHTYALKSDATFKAKIVENNFSGIVLQINGVEVFTQLIGAFNAYNLLVVYGVAILSGLEKNEVLRQISMQQAVDGRFQSIKSAQGVHAIVDYAHTPDALDNVLSTINKIRTNQQDILCVVGCGGDRDKKKRPIMGQIAAQGCQMVILTSDNPRSEDPQAILDEMEMGIGQEHRSKVIQVLDRKQAIRVAVKMAKKEDIILIAGKGHEKYQEIKGIRTDFDDLKIIEEMFNEMKK